MKKRRRCCNYGANLKNLMFFTFSSYLLNITFSLLNIFVSTQTAHTV